MYALRFFLKLMSSPIKSAYNLPSFPNCAILLFVYSIKTINIVKISRIYKKK